MSDNQVKVTTNLKNLRKLILLFDLFTNVVYGHV